MLITFEELRQIKHTLPKGSVKRIATHLNVAEQDVRTYFSGQHKQAGPKGGIVLLEDVAILNLANQLLRESQSVGSR